MLFFTARFGRCIPAQGQCILQQGSHVPEASKRANSGLLHCATGWGPLPMQVRVEWEYRRLRCEKADRSRKQIKWGPQCKWISPHQCRFARAAGGKCGGIAQLGEHQAGSLRVRGSNPLASTIFLFSCTLPNFLLRLCRVITAFELIHKSLNLTH